MSAPRADRHHVDPGLEEAHVVGHRGGVLLRTAGGVHDAVGLEREERVDVVGGGQTDRVAAGQLAGVTPHLVGAVHPHPDELEVGAVAGWRGWRSSRSPRSTTRRLGTVEWASRAPSAGRSAQDVRQFGPCQSPAGAVSRARRGVRRRRRTPGSARRTWWNSSRARARLPARSSRSASAYQRRRWYSFGRLHALGPLAQQGERLGEPALVGERAGVDDAALGDELGRRRHRGQLQPQLLDLAPPALGPVAVHEHRVLVDRVAQVGVGLELLGRGGVVADPVLREAGELADARRVGQLLAQRPEDPQRLALAVVGEGVGRGHERAEGAVGVAAGHLRHLLLHVGGAALAAAARRRGGRRRAPGARAASRRGRCACRRSAAPSARPYRPSGAARRNAWRRASPWSPRRAGRRRRARSPPPVTRRAVSPRPPRVPWSRRSPPLAPWPAAARPGADRRRPPPTRASTRPCVRGPEPARARHRRHRCAWPAAVPGRCRVVALSS